MKKVINKLLYDTKTAELIVKWDNGYFTNDFNYCGEDLYLTENGNYFLYGEGGAMSKYATYCGNSQGGGEDIIPLTAEEVIIWLQENNFPEILVERFPDKIKLA